MLEILVAIWMAATSVNKPAPEVSVDPPALQQQTQEEPKGETTNPEAPKQETTVQEPKQAKAIPISCVLKVDGHNIVAYATGDSTPRSGSYLLEVKKTGRNVAKTRQGGDFDLLPGETMPLATVAMKAGAGEKIAGHLEVTWEGGKSECGLP